MPLEYRMVRQEDSIAGLYHNFTDKYGQDLLEGIERHIQENPDNIAGYAMKILVSQRDPEAAMSLLQETETKFGEHDLLHHLRGMIYEKSGDRDRALDLFKKAITLNPINTESRTSLATLLNRAGRHEEAIGYWKQIIELDPELFFGWAGIARSEYELEDYERALKHANAAIFTAPKKGFIQGMGNAEHIQSTYRTNRALIYLEAGDLEKALQDFGEAFKFDSKEAIQSLKNSIKDSLEKDKIQQAEILLRKMGELDPNCGGDFSLSMILSSMYAKDLSKNVVLESPYSIKSGKSKPKPNGPCPCGSGKKFKKCCRRR